MWNPSASIMGDEDMQNIVDLFNNGIDVKTIENNYGRLSSAAKEYFSTVEVGEATLPSFSAAQNGAAVAMQNFAKAAKLAVTNFLVMMAITAVIKGISWAIDKLVVTSEELAEAADKARENYEDLVSEIDDLNDKLDETQEHIHELENLGSLSLSEQEELETLKRQNDELERELRIKESLARIAAQESAEATAAVLEDDKYDSTQETYARGNPKKVNELEHMNELLDTLEAKRDILNQKKQELREFEANWTGSYEDMVQSDTWQKLNTSVTLGEQAVSEFESIVADAYETMEADSEGLVDVNGDVVAGYEDLYAQVAVIKDRFDRYLNPDTVEAKRTSLLNSNENFTKDQLDTLSDEEIEIAYSLKDTGDMTFEELQDAIEETKKIASEPMSMSDYVKELETLSDGFEEIASIYEDVKDAGNFDFSALASDSDFSNTFKGYTEEYNAFIEAVSNSPTDITACQDAFDNLVTAWIYGQDVLQDITDETYDLTVQWLKQKGITNAVELADNALAKAKREAYVASHDLVATTADEVQALLDEAEQAGVTGNQLLALQMQIIAVNATHINVEQDIASLKALGTQAGLTAAQIAGAMAGASSLSKIQEIATYQGQLARNGYSDAEIKEITGYANGYSAESAIQQAASNMLEAMNSLSYSPTATYKPPGSGSSTGSSSSSDPYTAEIDKYEQLSNAVEEVETQIEHLNKAYDYTDDIEEQIALQDELIGLYQKEKDALDALNNARDEDISENVAKLRSQGFDVEYDPKADTLLIKNKEHINELAESIREEYDELIQETEELNDANKDAAEQWTELSYSILDAKNEIKELLQQKYDNTIDDIETMIELLEGSESTLGDTIPYYEVLMRNALKRIRDLVKDGFEENKDEIKDLMSEWMSYYDALIEREIELQELKQEDQDAALSAIDDLFEERIKKIDDEIDALNKANDERKESLELQKAQAALDSAKSQKTRKVLRQGVGFVYEADEDAIKEAEETLADLKFEETISALEEQKEALEELQNKWAEIPDLFEKYMNALIAEELLGADWESDILNDRIGVYDEFKDTYFDIQREIYDLTEELNNKTNESYLQTMQVFQQMMSMYMSANETISSTSSKSWYVNQNGKAPSEAQVGDYVYTRGGTYLITDKDANGNFTSQKINDTSTAIPDRLWGTEIKNGTSDLTEILGTNVLSNQAIVNSAEEQTDAILKGILGEEYLSKLINENSNYTTEEIVALLDNIDMTDLLSDYTDSNTDATDGNTDVLYSLISVLRDLGLEVEELVDNPFADIDYSSLSSDELSYIKQLQDAYKIAIANGNSTMANTILEFLQDFKDGFGDEYIQIGKNALLAATASYGEVTKSPTNSAERTSVLENSLKQAVSAGASDDYIARLERAIAVEKYGSGTNAYTTSNGYVTETVTAFANALESYMTADEIKQKYDAENGIDNGYNSQQMLETIANRVAESVDDSNSFWGSVYVKDMVNALNDTVWANELASLGDNLSSLLGSTWDNYSPTGTTSTSTSSSSSSKKSTGAKYAESNLSQSDQDKIAAAQRAYNEAKAKGDTEGMNKAHADAEAIRNKNGYSGGDDGSQVIVSSNSKLSKSVANNTDAVTYVGDSNYDVVDSNKELIASNKELAASNDKLASTNSSSRSSGSSSKKSSSSSSSSTSDKLYATIVNRDDSSSKPFTTTSVSSRFGNRGSTITISKKAKGGLDLDAGTYNVDELGAELLVQPEQGRYVRLSAGSGVIPADVTQNLWDIGINPPAYIKQALNGMFQNLGSLRPVAQLNEIRNEYHIGTIALPNVQDVNGFIRDLPNLPNLAKQYMTSK